MDLTQLTGIDFAQSAHYPATMVRLALLAPLALLTACSAGTAEALTCQASGAKHLTPALSDAAACARFLAGIAAIPDVTSVQLKVLPQGVLSAIVTLAGTSGAPGDFGLTVSDRAITADDLDRLAENVVAELARKILTESLALCENTLCRDGAFDLASPDCAH